MKQKFKIKTIAFMALFCMCLAFSYAAPEATTEITETITASLAEVPFEFSKNLDVIIASGAVMATFDVETLKIPLSEYEQLKAKYGKLYVINIAIDKEETYQFFVIRPSRNLLSAVREQGNDLDKCNDMIIKNMVVGGNMDSLDDGIVYSRLMEEIAHVMDIGESFLSKA